jgi:uncharacterized protein YeaO (DUF488 family)
MPVSIKRVYAPPAAADGIRVLVDRLWPRGLKKADVRLAFWLKDVAPSPKLRIWFDHQPERFEKFAERYRSELTGNPALRQLRTLVRRERVTLLYGARDPRINHAAVLQSVLRKRPIG